MNKVIIACDSFKDCVTSAEAGGAARLAVLAAYPEADVRIIDISDGGEGFLSAWPGLDTHSVTVQDPLGRQAVACYGMMKGGVAVVESAQSIGLGMLEEGERNPLRTSSYGLGQIVMDTLRRGAEILVIGLGGSSTNDGGMGMLEAMGWRFFRSDGSRIRGLCGGNIGEIESWSEEGVPEVVRKVRFVAACDVKSPFYGPQGAARVFAPQKGAGKEDVVKLDMAMEKLDGIVHRHTGSSLQWEGAGAAGGIAGAMKAFLGAEIRSGADLVLDANGFDEVIRNADLVITGEGRVDSQSLAGKLVSKVAARCHRAGVPAVAICGSCEKGLEAELHGLRAIIPVSPEGEPLEISMNHDLTLRRISSLALPGYSQST